MIRGMIDNAVDTVNPKVHNGSVPERKPTRYVHIRVDLKLYDRMVLGAEAEQRTITSLLVRSVTLYLAEMEARGEIPKD